MSASKDDLPNSAAGGQPPRALEERARLIVCQVLSLLVCAAAALPLVAMVARPPHVWRPLVGLAVLLALFGVVWFIARAVALAHIRGNGMRVTDRQLPHVLASVEKASRQLRQPVPEIYVVQFGKLRHAVVEYLAGAKILVLSSRLVDDCGGAELDFVAGREIAHIALWHHGWGFWLAPSALLPLAYSAWRRATEYTADLCGLAVCGQAEAAQRAMLVAAGGKLSAQVNLAAYHRDLPGSGGFWTTIRQMRARVPDINWRMARMMRSLGGPVSNGPQRSLVASILCAPVPAVNMQKAAIVVLLLFLVVGVAGEWRISRMYSPARILRRNTRSLVSQSAVRSWARDNTRAVAPLSILDVKVGADGDITVDGTRIQAGDGLLLRGLLSNRLLRSRSDNPDDGFSPARHAPEVRVLAGPEVIWGRVLPVVCAAVEAGAKAIRLESDSAAATVRFRPPQTLRQPETNLPETEDARDAATEINPPPRPIVIHIHPAAGAGGQAVDGMLDLGVIGGAGERRCEYRVENEVLDIPRLSTLLKARRSEHGPRVSVIIRCGRSVLFARLVDVCATAEQARIDNILLAMSTED